MNILVTGSAGMLGATVVDRLSGDHLVTGIDLPDGDLTDADQVKRIFDEARPEWVIHCAAWTDVDGAESQGDQAMAVNAGATTNLVKACERSDCGLTYVSTDYVFDGTGEGHREDDDRHPVNHYGLTKARGEEAVEAMDGVWQIVRTSWLFGDGPKNFVRTMRRMLDERETLMVVDDQTGCPTYAPDLAEILAYLVTSDARGIFHGTNAGSCTWCELARETARRSGHDPARILPCPSSEYPTPAARPRCSVLQSSRLEEAGCPDRPSWQDAVGRYCDLLASGRARHQ
jgi:dTDP-4-dehydrorhamnose reductase